MSKFFSATCLAASLALAAPVAVAGPRDAGPMARDAVVYVHPGFTGPQRRISGPVRNFRHLHFNDTISSLRVQGRWEVCTDPDFRGRCRIVDGPVGQLSRIRMNDNISSMRPVRRGQSAGPAAGHGDHHRPAPQPGIEGRWSVFFPRPVTRRGHRIEASQQEARVFCRRQGLGRVLYANTSRRYLNDLLCAR